MSSIGVFVTAEPYVGHNGYSLRLRWLDEGFNDDALQRDIVLHGADYVDAATAATHGRLGRSFGCPAVRPAVARPLIESIRDGSRLVAYYPDPPGSRIRVSSAAAAQRFPIAARRTPAVRARLPDRTQCRSSSGSAACSSTCRVAPPNTHSPKRVWP